MKYCPKCGKELSGETNFCSSCGTNLNEPQPQPAPPSSPSQPEKNKTSNKKKGCLGCLGIIVFFIIIVGILVGIFGGDSDKKTNTAQNTSSKSAQQAPAKKEEPAYVVNIESLGKVKGIYVSDVGIAISGVSKSKTIGDNQFTRKQAQGEFIVVRLVIANNQKDAITIDSSSFKIIDDKNREFSPSSEASMAIATSNRNGESFFLKKINPGITISGFVAFDVPPDITGVQLQVRGGMSGKSGMLPLEVQKTE